MTARRLQHASVPVPRAELERCARFYVEVLGMERIQNLAGIGWFRFGDGDHVHLLAGEPDPEAGAHFALQVDDLADTLERARRHGATPYESDRLWGAERWFVRDPVGNLIELFDEAPPD